MYIAVPILLTFISVQCLNAQKLYACSRAAALRGEVAQVVSCRAQVARNSTNAEAWDNLAIALSQTGDYKNGVTGQPALKLS
jgi:hypothetical protein